LLSAFYKGPFGVVLPFLELPLITLSVMVNTTLFLKGPGRAMSQVLLGVSENWLKLRRTV
jgi:hypothetical protein